MKIENEAIDLITFQQQVEKLFVYLVYLIL